MARIRAVKPDFFDDEDLAVHPFWVRILFEGLWCYADREGRLEDRPVKLKPKIFPYDEIDLEEGLHLLTLPKKHSPKHPPFIVRYEVDGNKYIQILNFQKHQSPHNTEKESEIPSFNGEIPVKEPLDKNDLHPTHDPKSVNLPLNPKSKDKVPDPADIRLVQLLIDLMLKNNPKSSIIQRLTEKRQEEWITQCRLLREADGKTVEEIERVIAFSQTDSFWKANILSMSKLREKWDQLWMKAQKGDPMAGIREWLAKKEAEKHGK